MKVVALASLLLLACSKTPKEPNAAAGATALGGAGSTSSGAVGTGATSPGAVGGGSGEAPERGGAGGASPGPPDGYDYSGCEQPKPTVDCAGRWCKVPAGCFVMGSPEGEWSHPPQEERVKVTLSRRFEIGQHEVTQAEWKALKLRNPSKVIGPEGGNSAGLGDCSGGDCPVGNVTWFEAVSYANLLSDEAGLEHCYDLTGCVNDIGQEAAGLVCDSFTITKKTIYDCAGYRLPTGAEWEYAARAGTRTAYYSGDIVTQVESGACVQEPALDAIAWYCFNAGPLTHPVGELEPNAWGLFDTIGNAAEWVNDQGNWVPSTSRLTDPDQSYGPGAARDLRGGAHFGWPSLCRVASRLGLPGEVRSPGRGFRLARTLP